MLTDAGAGGGAPAGGSAGDHGVGAGDGRRAGAVPAGGGASASALAALSTMVGAVVLARLADSPELAEAILAAAGRDVTSPARRERSARSAG